MLKVKMKFYKKSSKELKVLVVILIICLVGLAGWKAKGYFKGDLKIKISSASQVNSKDKFVSITIQVSNNSNHEQDFAWGNCAEQLVYFVDGVQINKISGVICGLGYPPFRAGEVVTRTERFDPTYLTEGSHTLKLVINGIESNTLMLQIAKARSTINDCYTYTLDVTPLCKNIVIHTNIFDTLGSVNNDRCTRIKERFINGTKLQPIPSLSTLHCDKGDNAYFIANVPAQEFKDWQEKLGSVGYDAEIFTANTTLNIPTL